MNRLNHNENPYRSCENLKPNDMSASFYNKSAQNAFKAMRCWYEVITKMQVEVLSLIYCGPCVFQFASMVTVAISPALQDSSSLCFLLMRVFCWKQLHLPTFCWIFKKQSTFLYINFWSSEYWSAEKQMFNPNYLVRFTLFYWATNFIKISPHIWTPEKRTS